MMRGAERDQVLIGVSASLGAQLQMVYVDEGAVQAAGYHATTVISTQHAPSNGGWYILGGSASAHVGARGNHPDVL